MTNRLSIVPHWFLGLSRLIYPGENRIHKKKQSYTLKAMPPIISIGVTPNLTSHSLRRAAAAYANESPSWPYSGYRRAVHGCLNLWQMHLPNIKEDQSVVKVLAGYKSPGLAVSTPSIRDLQQRLTIIGFGQLLTLRDELYHHALEFQAASFNVAVDVVDVSFAFLLMHLEVKRYQAQSNTLGFHATGMN
ncbi:LOW QUALITY PROTEIN: Hypothetical protein PHPALM_14162 [Phytophthora palmivora]|uniref:Uncharacterized protein n=1 Tax=Phytophthora palmivora TaxID=4796 RepID=A0A2P4XVF8_9STRA|nr:LOW QUALITY PROTEIN: Hypothetical protein PHPALM_14162 [Phytophthora palmivora]